MEVGRHEYICIEATKRLERRCAKALPFSRRPLLATAALRVGLRGAKRWPGGHRAMMFRPNDGLESRGDAPWHLPGDCGHYAGKSLDERLAGRFYTPDILSVGLARRMVVSLDRGQLGSRLQRIIDPFCGDGRLVIALLRAIGDDPELRRLGWSVTLCDQEAAAVASARHEVASAARALDLNLTIAAETGDTFRRPVKPIYDLVITNPPWELLKPDSREMAHMDAEEAIRYRSHLRRTSRALDARFPDAQGEKAWGGWGTNLARCGWDYCMRISRTGGVIGIILPSTLLGDQSSRRIRASMFDRTHVADVAAFPAEARLFDRVDQPVVALTLISGRQAAQGKLRLFGADRKVAAEIALAPATIASQDYCIPVGFGAEAQSLNGVLSQHPTLAMLEGPGPSSLWMGRELDETRVAEKMVSGLARPFVKGRMVQRHQIVEPPSQSVAAQFCQGFNSADKPRAVWRDVSRPSQRRRMIGAVIPPGWIAGNSLHVACYRDGDLARTKALHALLSSFVVEFQVRSRLATGHMSLGVVRLARVPALTAGVTAELAKLVDRAVAGEGPSADRLEILVAKCYGLSRNDMAQLLDSFPKVDEEETSRLLAPVHWDGV